VSPDQLVALALIGLAAGLLAGLLGVGGGIVMVPAMVLLLGFDQHVAQGTSLLVIIPAALTGSYTHYRNGHVVLREAMILAIGGIIGAAVGALFALSIPEELLQRMFAGLLLVLGLRMLLPRDLFTRGRPSSRPG
jgi:hypothetical protein